MKWTAGFIGSFMAIVSVAQVRSDVPIRSTGAVNERGVTGLAPPMDDHAAISVEVASSGMVHWGVANVIGDSISLVVQPPVQGYRDGLLLRFNAVGTGQLKLWLKTTGSPARPVVRHDGRPVDDAPLGDGTVAEVLYHNGKWILLNSTYGTCPPGSVAVNERLCMDATTFPGLRIYAAIAHCGDRGGRLCTWDEYVAGCSLASSELNGLFDEWEWIDDSANHTHTANQAGRFTCQSERTANAITLISGDTRCCFHPR